ncbi:hypothetical protein ACX3O0_03315 [Homoserinimonas sp. A447]
MAVTPDPDGVSVACVEVVMPAAARPSTRAKDAMPLCSDSSQSRTVSNGASIWHTYSRTPMSEPSAMPLVPYSQAVKMTGPVNMRRSIAADADRLLERFGDHEGKSLSPRTARS